MYRRIRLAQGSLASSYADTQDVAERMRTQQQFIAQLTVYALSAIGKGYLPLLTVEAAREWHRAEYADRLPLEESAEDRNDDDRIPADA